MTNYFGAMVIFLLIHLMIGLLRTLTRRESVNSILSIQLFTTISVAILLLLSRVISPYFANVALLFSLLGIFGLIAFVRYRNLLISQQQSEE